MSQTNSAFKSELPDQPHSSSARLIEAKVEFIDTSEDRPLLGDKTEETVQVVQSPETPSDEFLEPNPRLNGAQIVTCRVCENQIPYQHKTMQHVVRCPQCNEATPIRSAPTGKKFVRCPCNCLLVCKISSNRIQCPRAACGRVIILKPASSGEPTIPAPAGTARVSCFYCKEDFIFNTLANYIAKCPHCQKKSSVGIGYARSRSCIYFMAALAALLTEIFLMVWTIGDFSSHPWVIIIYLIVFIVMLVYCQRFYTFVKLKTSQILGPL